MNRGNDTAGQLLLGLLALQTGLIDQAALVAAFHAWTRDKARSLADHLVAMGHLDAAHRPLLEGLAAAHLARHGGDVEQSLAAIPARRSTGASLARIGDADIEGTLAHVGSGFTQQEGDSDPDLTATYSVGTTASDGQRFRVLRPHAQGGLGAVFVALDSELRREVALKQILDAHADDPISRQRFLLEAEVTGGLEHPGIVPVYGLGTYDDGRPFYAMRFIRGDSLKEAIEHFHADDDAKKDPGRRSLDLHKLLRRFTDVSNAIDYAHSRGVLHRDIKPGNIIVGRHGETLVVDWGLAKATGQSDAASGEAALRPSSASGSAETLAGSALGTPAYMSPEQAEGDLEHLGPRSDVYSLGATLYCLLTGRPPFAGEAADVIRAVQRGDFRLPRQIDPSIDPALEAICLRAMALVPADRYATPRALVDDIERWMADEPVSAWREPWSRRARRWGRRNRAAVSAAAVAVVAGLIGLGAVAAVQAQSNVALRKANGAKDNALADTRAAQALTQTALEQSEEARRQAAAAEKTARAEADKAQAINDFLSHDLLTQAEPGHTAVEDHVTLLDVLDRAAAKVGDRFTGQPEVEAALRRTIALTYHGLASWEKAERQWRAVLEAARRRLGDESSVALTALGQLAHTLRHRGRIDAGVLEMAKSSSEGLARVLGPDHGDTIAGRNDLAEAYSSAGRAAEAIALLEATLRLCESKLGPDHVTTLATTNNLAAAYFSAGRLAAAIELYEANLKACETKLGLDHLGTLSSRNNLGNAFGVAGRTAEAIALLEPTLKRRESKLGPDHPDTLTTRHNLANTYRAAGRTALAIVLHEETLKRRESVLGPDHSDTLASVHFLAHALAASRPAEAEPLFRRALAGYQKHQGPRGNLTIDLTRDLNSLLDRMRRSAAPSVKLPDDVFAP